MTDLVPALLGPHVIVEQADELAGYHRLRERVFVDEQGLFDGSDLDDRDDDPRTVVLVARSARGELLAACESARPPAGPTSAGGRAAGWSSTRGPRAGHRTGSGTRGLRLRRERGCVAVRRDRAGSARAAVPAARLAQRAAGHRGPAAAHADALADRSAGRAGRRHQESPRRPAARSGAGWPGVRRRRRRPGAGLRPDRRVRPRSCRPWWNATRIGPLVRRAGERERSGRDGRDAGRAAERRRRPDAALAARSSAVTPGRARLRRADTRRAHPARRARRAVATALAARPTLFGAAAGDLGSGCGSRPDLGGRWRPGYHGRQWDSTSHRTPSELRGMLSFVANARPAAAKDVSMAGIAGTLGCWPRPADAGQCSTWRACPVRRPRLSGLV